MAEVFRLFQLGLAEGNDLEYIEVGKQNFKQSIAHEPGTLAMYAAHLPDDVNQKIVVERYKNEEAYQAHVNSTHFHTFKDLGQKVFRTHTVVNLHPKVFLQKNEALRVFEQTDLSVRLATVVVTDSAAFEDIVLPVMKQSIAEESGIFVMYAGTDIENPNTWYFFEIYENETTYKSHIEKSYFKSYIERSRSLVLEKNLQVLVGEMLVNQNG
ncbi:hypothetical protein TP70_08500 [Staphylococcus microti]|uniref:Signal transduction protein TRAP n=1 Tax=Staphylococcus microti TaxID=569857 RepID=A0A0D6XN47_9STAP|nr:antibiotic biosynthesis monooxygenase [Staphylococcus microti]KIX90264.1 hypothetical protein TP70_08500 [Staphylococcus microti]PNZ82514.1 antibiotic biosynthesis monooxygenase [Staphylococcus microti]SUM57291.1 monooxygenase family protein [Staphylococcus microti]